MENEKFIEKSPWDTAVFDVDCYVIKKINAESLSFINSNSGHFTVKVDPLSDKKVLHRFGFYYCDTLLEPFVTSSDFVSYINPAVGVREKITVEELLALSHGVFDHGRFHRDFNIDRFAADLRYDNWARQLLESGQVFGIEIENNLAAFFGHDNGHVTLHSVASQYRGKGLAKYFWSCGFCELIDRGYNDLSSSVSVSNTAVMNLYCSLGFKFRNPVDVYHCYRK